jgi:hypothetical protein
LTLHVLNLLRVQLVRLALFVVPREALVGVYLGGRSRKTSLIFEKSCCLVLSLGMSLGMLLLQKILRQLDRSRRRSSPHVIELCQILFTTEILMGKHGLTGTLALTHLSLLLVHL